MRAYTRYRWENRTNRRYYEAWLSQDLLGDWVVTRVNGRLSESQGGVRHTLCDSEQEGIALLHSIHKIRRRPSHGYEVVL